VLGDDLALNAQQVTGIAAQRELPVVWAVARGSFINKLILVPAALLISAFLPWLITPLLMLGGAFLCFEGFEKIWHKLHHADEPHEQAVHAAMQKPEADLVALEQEKIKGAVRTDFILSAEIIVIALGVVAEAALTQRILVLSLIAVLMTIGVYGLVALIVKMDDIGLWLMQQPGQGLVSQSTRKLGSGMVQVVPYLMRLLSVLGTAAMFLVGGGILVHGLHPLHAVVAQLPQWSLLLNATAGILAGGICFMLVELVKLFLKKD
jgi:predicted DNA repair protein MutK